MANELASTASLLRPAAPAMPPLLADSKTVCRLLCIGKTRLYELLASGRLPAPIRLGRKLLWRLAGPQGLQAWVEAGCPSRERWAAMQAARR